MALEKASDRVLDVQGDEDDDEDEEGAGDGTAGATTDGAVPETPQESRKDR